MSSRRQAAPPGRSAESGVETGAGAAGRGAVGRGAGRAGSSPGGGGSVSNGGTSAGPLPTRVPVSKQRGGNADPGRQPGFGGLRGIAAGRQRGRDQAGAARLADETPAAAGGAGGDSWPPGIDSAAAQQAPGLSARLMALARMIQIGTARSGRDGFSKKLLSQAEDVLGRAGERMRLSSAHTVVVLAGGTGSGKSSLFNCLAGADFSTVGVTRPVTKDAHACIWDDAGSGALLEWLGVPQRNRYSRASALGGGESGLAGLVLLDLPDHDSVMGHATGQVDRLVSLADVMIWVLDPQKYADAAVHQRFLIPLAGHSEVQAVVLNQSDLLTAAQIDDCMGDLRRLLDAEDLHDVPILVTSAVTRSGVGELRRLLAQAVAARGAAVARISADVDTVVARFAPYAGDPDDYQGLSAQAAEAGPAGDAGPAGEAGPAGDAVPAGDSGLEERISDESAGKLVDQFYAAAGVTAVGDALCSARELRAIDFVGWPVTWLAQRLTGRDPLRKVRLNMLWNDLRAVSSGPAGAQQAAIDNALSEFGNRVAESLPRPWSQTVKAAARSRADAIPAAVGEAIGAVVPGEDSIVGWWRLAGLLQGVLLGAVVVAFAWLLVILVFGVFHAASGLPGLLTDRLGLLWAVLAAAVALGLGVSTSAVSMRAVRKRAQAENTEIAADIRKRIEGIAKEMAIIPVQQELSEFDRYCEEFAIASKDLPPE
jgi:energy-coupling factor transporter ATP-binding protein EcfA2